MRRNDSHQNRTGWLMPGVLVIFLATGILLTATQQQPSSNQQKPEQNTPGTNAGTASMSTGGGGGVPTGGGLDSGAGAALYQQKCTACHGAGGAGKASLGTRALGSAAVQKQSNAELTKTIAQGKGKMPGYKSRLTEEQIRQLVRYIRTLAR